MIGNAEFASLLNRAVALYRSGETSRAERIYVEVLARQPREFNALQLLGLLRLDQGRAEEAIALMQYALQQQPKSAIVHNNLGVALFRLRRSREAIASYKRALSLKPDYAEAHCNVGMALSQLGRHDEAITSLRRALALKPDYAEAHDSMGSASLALSRYDDAAASFIAAARIKSDYAEAYLNLALTREKQGMAEEALASCRKAVSAAPESIVARWALVMYQLAPILDTPDQVARSRAAFSAELEALAASLRATRFRDGSAAVGSTQPFYLAYQEEQNVDILSRYGDMCAELMLDWKKQQRIEHGTVAHPLTRVGIVTAYVRDHSVWNAIVKGWIAYIERRRLDVHVFHLASERDDDVSSMASQPTYHRLPGGDLQACVASILGSACDALIYPEIGMDTMTTRLASLRLAPVQAASWGHPETTGLPTIDYFLSAEDFEPPEASRNYREKLVMLPRLGCCYEPSLPPVGRPNLGGVELDPDTPILLSAGTPFKYAPGHDRVFVEIARRLGRCKLIFFTRYPGGVSEKLKARIATEFAAAGLKLEDFAAFIPWQDKPGLHALIQRADAMLDTIGFSGFNTAMLAIEGGLPVVAYDGRFMRGRLASGIIEATRNSRACRDLGRRICAIGRSADSGRLFQATDSRSYCGIAFAIVPRPRDSPCARVLLGQRRWTAIA